MSIVLIRFMIVHSISYVTVFSNMKTNNVQRLNHQRHHGRSGFQFMQNNLPFHFSAADPRCIIPNTDRIMLSCPQKHYREPLKCIEFHDLCDDHVDCLHGEDEDAHFCMFKKLEDAELYRIKSKIRSLIEERNFPKLYNDIITSENTDFAKSRSTEREPEDEVRSGIFKIQPNSGPLGKFEIQGHDAHYDNSEYYDSEDDYDESFESSVESSRHHKTRRKRSYHHHTTNSKKI